MTVNTKMQTMIVKARHGLKIFDPVTRQFIDPEGHEVPADQYWNRRLSDGDVEIVEPEYVTRMLSAKPAARRLKKTYDVQIDEPANATSEESAE